MVIQSSFVVPTRVVESYCGRYHCELWLLNWLTRESATVPFGAWEPAVQTPQGVQPLQQILHLVGTSHVMPTS